MKINVHIERLILANVGIQPHQESELKEAVESAIRQRFLSQGIGAAMHSDNSRSVVGVGSLSLEGIPTPDNLGQQIGHAVYKGIGT